MSTIPVNEIVNQQNRLASLPEELLLGHLAWYSMSSSFQIDHAEFVRQMVEAGLDTDMPHPPEASDVFKRAASEFKQTKLNRPDGTVDTYLIRLLRLEPDGQVNQIILEKNEPGGDRLKYGVIADLHFNRTAETIDVSCHPADGQVRFSDEEQESASYIGLDVIRFYRSWRHSLSDMPLRAMIRHLLDRWGAVAVRPSGGIYFLRNMHTNNLAVLDQFINALPGASLHILPLIDDMKQRQMLRAAYEDESVGEVDRMIGDIQNILSVPERSVTMATATKLQERFLHLTGKMAEYSDLLDTAMEMTGSRLEILQETIMEVMATRLKDGK